MSESIHITSITPPEQGWTIAMHCPICKETVFMLSPYAAKPQDGDYWKMQMCADDVNGFKHNIELGMNGSYAPMNLETRKPSFMVLDPMCPPRFPSVYEYMFSLPIEEAKRRYPDTPIEEKK